MRGLEGGVKREGLVLAWKSEEGEERRQDSAMVREVIDIYEQE